MGFFDLLFFFLLLPSLALAFLAAFSASHCLRNASLPFLLLPFALAGFGDKIWPSL